MTEKPNKPPMIRTILLLAFFLIAASAHSQCNDYYDFKNGSVWEMKHKAQRENSQGMR
jgi:hypothetical protein